LHLQIMRALLAITAGERGRCDGKKQGAGEKTQ
jgi:hypothetical protein